LLTLQTFFVVDENGVRQMHPDLKLISDALEKLPISIQLRFALKCVEEVEGNLEDEVAIAALKELRNLVSSQTEDVQKQLQELAKQLNSLASSHHGSKSIDGTRHAAVSATYALARAANQQPVDAAAYAAYSLVYGYGGYAVNDPDAFAEVHRRQMDYLKSLIGQSNPAAILILRAKTVVL
jgi:hypothetical protein